MVPRTVLTGSFVLFLSLIPGSLAQERKFTRRYEMHVPPAPLAGPRPDRTIDPEFNLPDTFEVLRVKGPEHGLRVVDKNEGGMDQRYWAVSPTGNGVKIEWKMRNGERFPVTGRDAFLVVELVGRRKPNVKMSLSPRYAAMRDRFLKNFFFSGLVAEATDPAAGRVKFSDQTMHMGLALAVFATEVAIRKDAGDKTDDPKQRIKELLDAFDELDKKAEGYFGGTAPNQLNGLFVRDDVTGADDPRLGKRFKTVHSDWQQKAQEDASPSGDQIFSMMFGLYCVVRFADDPVLTKHAKDISARLYDYAKRCYFELQLPNGQKTRRGSEMQWLSSLLHGMNQNITGQNLFRESKYKLFGVERPLNDIGGFWAKRESQDFIAGHTGKSVDVLGFKVELNSFALHLLLMALAPSDVWPHDVLEEVAMKCNHQLAELVYCQAHGSLPRKFGRNEIQTALNACPDDGPRAAAQVQSGWQQDNRWVRCTKVSDKNEGPELFNGLDWLLLHNFEQLVFVGP